MSRRRPRTEESQPETGKSLQKSRKALEGTAAFGLILVAVALAVPFTSLTNTDLIGIFKWVYAPGALIFTVARLAGSTDRSESMRIRRLRRMEFWAGVAFCIGAFFWFYNEHKFSPYLPKGTGAMAYLRDTIYFSLSGALIQVVAVFAISRRLKKEQNG